MPAGNPDLGQHSTVSIAQQSVCNYCANLGDGSVGQKQLLAIGPASKYPGWIL
jgi:hypothetical protein